MPYTVDDTTAVRARIEADLLEAVRVVRQCDPGLRSLVLTGGFARGEGAVLDGRPQNDYDLVAIRRARVRPRRPYKAMQKELEAKLGLHVDLAPVAAWRLRHTARTIFWYETAQRGRVLWGEHLLHRVPIHGHHDLERAEGLRLLVNRAAGLLLSTTNPEAHAKRLQAAKAILAAADAHLLAHGAFAPSQTERWRHVQGLRAMGREPEGLAALGDWLDWAYRFKVDPGHAPPKDALQAWQAARRAILGAVPPALAHAGLRDLAAYARRDGIADHVAWMLRGGGPGRSRLARNPTGRVRVATLRLLEEAVDARLPPGGLRRELGRMAGRRADEDPVGALDELRQATLQ